MLKELNYKLDLIHKESVKLFKLVSVLRAADRFWSPERRPVLVHLQAEGPSGDTPCILVRAQGRSVLRS